MFIPLGYFVLHLHGNSTQYYSKAGAANASISNHGDACLPLIEESVQALLTMHLLMYTLLLNRKRPLQLRMLLCAG